MLCGYGLKARMSKASKIKGSYYKEKLPPASSEKITFPFGIIVRQ